MTSPTDTHHDSYELPALTGLSQSNLLWLEHLGVFPSSACDPEKGRIWPADEVTEWVAFLDQPGVLAWVVSLLPAPQGDQPAPTDRPQGEE